MAAVSWTRSVSLAFFACSLIWATGCVGPLACGPTGDCGPVAFSSCDGCGDCEGCGELYIDPWINHPADVCDPCDRCGNYNGQSCGKCRSVFSGIASLWGYRCDVGCGCGDVSCGGCDGVIDGCCGDSCDGCDSGCVSSEVTHLTGEPTPAAEVVKVVPTERPYRPSRTRKIFRGDSTLAEGPPQAINY